jgi:thiol-disulfide isomerase/thioredoxin
MKKHSIIISALLISILGFSQGIKFEQGTWKEVLEKARQINKPIFLNVYKPWSVPCKQMNNEVFPLAEVGNVYNANFICYQLDAEKGEGMEIAKKYNIEAYPAYLFINGNEKSFFHVAGAKETKELIELSKSAFFAMNDTVPITVWEKEYIEKKNDTTFLLAYINKRSRLSLPVATLFDEYLKLIPEEERTSDPVLGVYKKVVHFLNEHSFAIEYLLKNKAKFIGKRNDSFNDYLYQTAKGTMWNDVRSKSKNTELLAIAIEAYDQLPKNTVRAQRDEIYIDYYFLTRETDQYLKYATHFCDNYLMKTSTDSIDKTDQLFIKTLDKQRNSITYSEDITKGMEEAISRSQHMTRDRIGDKLNSFAWEIFKRVSDTETLKNALRWSGRSLELSINNPYRLDTYANLLYKLGQKEEAIAKEEEALRFAAEKDLKGFTETLLKMKTGEKTWSENIEPIGADVIYIR